MTSGQKREIANVIIEELNRAATRVYAREHGKAATVHDVILYSLDGEDLLPGSSIEIRQMVKAAANDCLYPLERIPFITCRLSFEDISRHSDLSKKDWQKLMDDLACIIDVMADNEDERMGAIREAFEALSKITEYGEKLK